MAEISILDFCPREVAEKPSVLFVSSTNRRDRPYLDPSSRYRSFNVAASLARLGHRTACISQLVFDADTTIADRYDFIHFHRPTLNEANVDFLFRERMSPRIIADFDDGTIRVADAGITPAVRFYDVPLRKVARDISCMAEACRFFDKFTLSTEPLSEQVETLFGPRLNKVVSNALDPAFLGIARLLREQGAGRPRPYRIGYFPGTASHNGDFASVAKPLAAFLAAHREVRMLVVGPVELPEPLRRFRSRIVRQSVVPFHHLPHTMALCDTVIAPLERTPFTNAKSGIKFFEAAVVGCSVIATPIRDIARFDSPLLHKADSSQEWRAAFESALTQPLDDTARDAAACAVERIVSADIVYGSWASEVLQ